MTTLFVHPDDEAVVRSWFLDEGSYTLVVSEEVPEGTVYLWNGAIDGEPPASEWQKP